MPDATGVAGCHCEPIPCEQTPYPTCAGVCPDGTYCVPDAIGGGGCRCEPLPCELSPEPQCGGPCDHPDQSCLYIAAIEECRCYPDFIPCEQSIYPKCDESCPPGQQCVPGTTLVPPIPGCVCEPIACEQSPAPTCDGPCAGGGTCYHDPLVGDCRCEPPLELCSMDLFGACLGDCPDGEVCTHSTTGEGCTCLPGPCTDGPFPQCNGICPGGTVCQPDPSGIAQCTCVETPCEELPVGATCDGPCPQAGQQCEHNPATGQCFCDPPPTRCEEAIYPSCDLFCPPGQVCVPGKFGHCRCIPAPCENTIAPTCDGPCPQVTQQCKFIPSLDDCRCKPPLVDCEFSLYPICNGTCPVGTVCVPGPGGHCLCRPIHPPACHQTPFPACNGTCPPGWDCDPSPLGGCGCVCIITPPWDDIVVGFASKDIIIWSPNPCAIWYNVYRSTVTTMPDLNGDGLADDYGSCFDHNVMATETTDTSVPDPGYMHVYVIQGVNDVGPGSLGYSSSGLERMPSAACP